MSQMIGADADALDALATRFDQAAQQLDQTAQHLRSQLHSSPWQGVDADQFRQVWDGDHARTLQAAATYLRDAGDSARRNAREQRHASEAEGGGGPTHGEAGNDKGEKSDKDEALDDLAKFLETLGITGEALAEIMKMLDHMGLAPEWISDLVGNEGLKELLSGAGKVLDVAGIAIDFFSDLAENSELPMDERMIHALVETGVGALVDVGLDKGATWLGGVIGGALGFGAGSVPGAAIGWCVGQLGSMAFDAADDAWNITDGAADRMVELYRFGKENDWNVANMAADVAASEAGQVVSNVVDGAANIADSAVDAGKDIWNWATK